MAWQVDPMGSCELYRHGRGNLEKKKNLEKTAVGPADYAKSGVFSFKAYVGDFPPFAGPAPLHWASITLLYCACPAASHREGDPDPGTQVGSVVGVWGQLVI